MAISEIFSILTGVADTISGGLAKSESDALAEKMRALKAVMPEEATKAEISARNARYGIPGRELFEERARELMGTSLEMQKQVSQSPSAMISQAGEAMNATNRRYQDIMVADAAERRRNEQRYQDILMGKARMDLGIQGQNLELDYAALMQEAQGTKDLFTGISRGIGTGIETYGTMKEVEYQKEMGDMYKGFFGDSGEEDREFELKKKRQEEKDKRKEMRLRSRLGRRGGEMSFLDDYSQDYDIFGGSLDYYMDDLLTG